MTGKSVVLWVLILVLVLGFGLKCGYDADRRTEGERAILTQQLAAQSDSVGKLLLRLSSAYRVDTVRLTKRITERQLVRDTVEIERWLHDTVPVPVEVVRTVLAADSTVIQACTIAIRTCEQETSLLRAQVRIADSLATIWKAAAKPSLWQQAQSTARTVMWWELGKLVVGAAVRR